VTSSSGKIAADTASDTRLGQLVGEELVALRAFVGILQKEQQALIDGDLERLTPLIDEKTSHAGRLGQLAEQRNQVLAAAALALDRAGMESWLAQQSAAAKASQGTWENLLTLTAEARALNESNGKLIATRLQHNQQTLSALLAAGNQATLYGPDGHTQASGGGRLFGAA